MSTKVAPSTNDEAVCHCGVPIVYSAAFGGWMHSPTGGHTGEPHEPTPVESKRGSR